MTHNNKLNRKKILNFFNKIKIKSNSFSFPDLTILISLFLIIFSIFTPWFSVGNNNNIEWFFSNTLWLTWYISLFLILINLFIFFSNSTKQKIKLFLNQNISDNQIFTTSTIIFIILWINSYFIIKNWISLFTNEINIYVWIKFYLIAIILYSSWIFFKLKQKNSNTDFVSINESEEYNKSFSKKETKKNVMKLPFE